MPDLFTYWETLEGLAETHASSQPTYLTAAEMEQLQPEVARAITGDGLVVHRALAKRAVPPAKCEEIGWQREAVAALLAQNGWAEITALGTLAATTAA